MKYRLSPWLLAFFAMFLASETVFAAPHIMTKSMEASKAGYAAHHTLVASTATGLTSSNPTRVATALDGQGTHMALSQDVQPVNAGLSVPAAAKVDVTPVYDPASLFLLGISLLGLAGICRRRLEAKRTH
ncbi:hypothetical protein DBB_36530 [Desulfoluna spongiiphila]|nr:hypothetical protein DBB_36530 [Desulfoluna spongiiphila]